VAGGGPRQVGNLGFEQDTGKARFNVQTDFEVEFAGRVNVFRALIHHPMINSAAKKRMLLNRPAQRIIGRNLMPETLAQRTASGAQ
jgi:hypothetical protein